MKQRVVLPVMCRLMHHTGGGLATGA